ncbi:MAG: pyruvate formate-lyase-activating protein [Turicibacter sp.]|nr:pyruvate formate-lyase-activating protein [Turicibacter sp.]
MYDGKCVGYVHSVDSGGMVDGPGIRYLVFLSGCSLRCKYCHNPDTWKLKSGAVATVEAVLRDIKKYRSYLKFSDGGVTITGGEPFVQAEFLAELLAACRETGLHTVLDSSGNTSVENAEKVLKNVDLLLLDIKSINAEVYKRLTGVELENTINTLKVAERLGVKTWIRYVLVPGYTDDMDDVRALAEFLQPFENVEKIEILPFHKMGEYKWDDLNMEYELRDVEPPPAAIVDRAREILRLKQ